MADSDLSTTTQHAAGGGTGYQNINHGANQQLSMGSGHQYNAQTINFDSNHNADRYREERISIMQSLQTTPYKDNMNRNPDPVSGTCEWFLGHKLFRQWLESPKSTILWVSADPGSGKSVLAKRLVNTILPREHQSSLVTYFFFKDDNEGQRSAKSALQCILHQLFLQKEELLSQQIVGRFKTGGGHATKSLQNFWDILVMALSQRLPEDDPSTVVCVLDALDECSSAEQDQLMTLFCDFYRSSITRGILNLKMLVTSRPIGAIRKGFNPLLRYGLSLIHLSGEDEKEVGKIKREIDLVIKAEVDDLQSYHQLDDEERKILLSGLKKFENRTYLWVHLTLDVIKRQFNEDMDLASITSTLPLSVDAAYERMLSTSPDKEKAKRLLHIILAAFRPMTVKEMNFALALQPHHKTYDEVRLTPESRFREYVRGLCGLLVTVVDSKVYFLHQTVREFLTRDNAVDSNSYMSIPESAPVWKSSLQLQESHRVITEICFWNLSFPGLQIADPGIKVDDSHLDTILSPGSKSKLQQVRYVFLKKHIFFEYSALSWIGHFMASGTAADTDSAVSLVCMDGPCDGRSPTWFEVLFSARRLPVGFTSLMIACYCGLDQVVNLLLKDSSVDVNATDSEGQSALSWALIMAMEYQSSAQWQHAKARYTATVDLLLSTGPEIESDLYGRTPLHIAAYGGNKAIAQRLLEIGANVNAAMPDGGTPLHFAFNACCTDLMKLFISAGANVNAVTRDGDSMLTQQLREMGYSSRYPDSFFEKRIKILKILLDGGADVNVVDKNDDGPLSAALRLETPTKVIQMLLDAGADIDATNKYGRTPVAIAAEQGDLSTMQLFIDAGADVNKAGKFGKTPISVAIEKENPDMIHMLMEAGADVNNAGRFRVDEIVIPLNILNEEPVFLQNITDMLGDLPISMAIRRGNPAIVQMLMEAGADVNKVGRFGKTPISIAAKMKNPVIIKMLVDAGAVVGRFEEETISRLKRKWNEVD